MYESFSAEPQFVFIIILTAIVFGTMALTVLAVAGMWTWRKHRATRIESDLKLEMLAAGMSADEIERILAAKMSGR